jgi:hypothetical protein
MSIENKLPLASTAATARFTDNDGIINHIMTFMSTTSSRLMYLTDVQVDWLNANGYEVRVFSKAEKRYQVIWG